jgi:hypothetical protein
LPTSTAASRFASEISGSAAESSTEAAVTIGADRFGECRVLGWRTWLSCVVVRDVVKSAKGMMLYEVNKMIRYRQDQRLSTRHEGRSSELIFVEVIGIHVWSRISYKTDFLSKATCLLLCISLFQVKPTSTIQENRYKEWTRAENLLETHEFFAFQSFSLLRVSQLS